MKYRNPISLCLLFLWGTATCLFYGRIGFMPLDHSVVFDGAWRIISGQVPFRDFNAPNSIVPFLLQVPFFKLFGINWLVYCLHASILNGIFCVLVFFCLRWLGGSRLISFFYAILSGFIFYPPYGTPCNDQHAFFFVMLALVIALFAAKSRSLSTKVLFWFLLPIAMVSAYLSKQIPTVFAVPAVLFIVLMTTKKNHLRIMLAAAFASVTGIIIIFFAAFKIFKMDFVQMKLSLWTWPLQMGAERLKFCLSKYSIPKMLKGLFYPLPLLKFTLNLYSFHLVYVSAFVVFALFMLSSLKIFSKSQKLDARGNYLKIFLSMALLVICNVFVMFTLNQGENGLPYLFAGLGLMHIVIISYLPSQPIQKKTIILRYALSILFICVAVSDAVRFNNNVNRTRIVHDFRLSERARISSASLPAELKFIDFVMPHQYRFNPADLKKVAHFLKERKTNFFLIGDTSILYALAHRPSTNPALWFHPGLSIPALDSDDFRLYEERVLENLRKYKVNYLVLEGNQTWFGISLNHFRRLGPLIRKDSLKNRSFGGFKVLRIDFNKRQ